LRWWRAFLETHNGISILPMEFWSEKDAALATDACLSGAGAVIHGAKKYFHVQFPEAVIEQGLFIHHLELLTVVVAMKLWAHLLPGQRVLLACDNEPSVFAINTGRSRDERGVVGACLRELWLLCSRHQIELRAKHIAGVEKSAT
jgi:hypothetical protein